MTSSPLDARVVPVPAATVVLLRPGPDGPEVLLTQRPSTMAFGPGLHVFPGGKVDPEDGATDGVSPAEAAAAAHRLGDNVSPAEAVALHRAAIRELREEVGVELTGMDRLVPIAQWTTPRFMPRRFSTWFFVADLPPDAEPVFEPDEVIAHRWLTIDGAFDALAAGEIQMWVPTSSTLERLASTGAQRAVDVAGVIRFTRTEPPVLLEEGPDVVRFRFGEVGALPGGTGETTLIGRRELVLVDPGDPSDQALDAIDAAVARRAGRISAIVLTRTDPDHAAGAEALAIPLGIPILAAPGADRRLPYATEEVDDGARLPTDVPVRVRLGPPGSGRLELVRDDN